MALGAVVGFIGCSHRPALVAAEPVAPRVLTAVDQIRQLPLEEAESGSLPVRIQGVVTYHDPAWSQLFVQDETAGVFVRTDGERMSVAAGDWVEVEGIVESGRLTPVIARATLKVIRPAVFPPAREADFAEVAAGREDGQWIVLRGTVRAVDDWRGRTRLELSTLGQRWKATVFALSDANLRSLVGAAVRIRGVGATSLNPQGQVTGWELLVPASDEVGIEQAPPLDPFRVRKYINEITPDLEPEEQDHLVSVAGLVIRYNPGEEIHLRDRTGDLLIQTRSTILMRPGMWIEAAGYPGVEGARSLLQDALFRRVGYSSWVSPDEVESAVISSSVENGRTALTNIAQIRRLQPTEANRPEPVRIRGVVTYYDPVDQMLFVQDESEGIYVQFDAEASPLDVQLGDRAVIDGVTGSGDFAPVIRWPRLSLQGPAPLPIARKTSLATAMTGREDGQWIELDGVIQRVSRDGKVSEEGERSARGERLFLELTTEGRRFEATVLGAGSMVNPESLISASVSLQGVGATVFNERRQLVGFKLMVPETNRITNIKPPPLDPSELVVQPVNTVLRFDPSGATSSWARVQGVVTARRGDGGFYVQDESGGMLVVPKDEPEVTPGEVVDVAGRPQVEGTSPALTAALVNRLGRRAMPKADAVSLEEILSGKYYGQLVEFDGLLVQVSTNRESTSLTLQVDTQYLDAVLDSTSAPLAALRVGSTVNVQGVCENRVERRGWQLLLVSEEAVRVLNRASWWTAQRLRHGLLLAGAISLAGALWTGALQRRVRVQTALIRQRLEKEAALERRYQNLVEDANDIIYTIDLEGRFTSINRAGEVVSGFRRDEMLGRRFDEFTTKQMSRAMRERLALRLQGNPLGPAEIQIVAKGGRRVDLEVNTRVLTEAGRPVGLQGIARDITDRKRAEESLRRSEERFARAFHASPIAISITTLAEGRYLDVNDAFLRLVGHHREDVVGHTSLELRIWANPDDRIRMVNRLRTHQSVRDMEMRLLAKEGDVKDTLASLETIELRGERCVLGILYDITGRLQLEAQFRQAQKMEIVGQLAAGVAHDFNNILTIIQGYTSILQAEAVPDSDSADSLEQVADAAQRASNLTRQLLAFSRRQVMQLVSLDLNSHLQSMVRMIQRILGERIVVEVRLAERLSAIKADGGMIEQIVLNLVVNARDAMPLGGSLILSTEEACVTAEQVQVRPGARQGLHVCLSVTDTGCGMDEATQSRLFEPFFTTKEVGKGTGLGLATVYGIVEQHGGWIEVASHPGAGSSFRIFLPVDPDTPAPDATTPVESAGPGDGRERILLVEDEPALRGLAGQILRRKGYRVTEAASGDDALLLWRARAEPFDLVFTDMVMPGGLSGKQLADLVRADDSAVAVLFTSGYNLEIVGADFVLKEGVNFLPKPYRAASMLGAVRECLDRRTAA
ncbi:MAG: PAS domain S-box protein [Limisphaerales bacterium]